MLWANVVHDVDSLSLQGFLIDCNMSLAYRTFSVVLHALNGHFIRDTDLVECCTSFGLQNCGNSLGVEIVLQTYWLIRTGKLLAVMANCPYTGIRGPRACQDNIHQTTSTSRNCSHTIGSVNRFILFWLSYKHAATVIWIHMTNVFPLLSDPVIVLFCPLQFWFSVSVRQQWHSNWSSAVLAHSCQVVQIPLLKHLHCFWLQFAWLSTTCWLEEFWHLPLTPFVD